MLDGHVPARTGNVTAPTTRYPHDLIPSGHSTPLSFRVAYMATISAIPTSDNPFKARYLALIARTKPKKRAIVAVMRTMIVTLNAMVSHNMPCDTKHAA